MSTGRSYTERFAGSKAASSRKSVARRAWYAVASSHQTTETMELVFATTASFSSRYVTRWWVISISGLYAREMPADGRSGEFVQAPSRKTPMRMCEYAEMSSVHRRSSVRVSSS